MSLKIDRSIVYPDVWFIRLDRSTIQLSTEEIRELINEARRINKELK